VIWVLLVGSALLLTYGCRRNDTQPRVLYERAWHEIELGNLTSALQQANSAVGIYAGSRSEWYFRFRALKAEILLREGSYEDSLGLLNFDLPPDLAASDIAVWQKLSQGADFAYLAQFPAAQTALEKAQSLAQFSQPQLLGEAMLRLGTLASLQLNLSKAQASYHTALDLAREQRNTFLEASALGSLGLLATQSERFDESIEWNRQALQVAESLGALSLVAKIEGNIAWSYQRMGDLENSLTLNKNAERDALRAGLQQDRVLSLLNIGSIYFEMGDLVSAESESQKALGFAKDLKDASNSIYCLQNLALIAIEKGHLSQAQQDIDEILSLESLAPDQSQKLDTRLTAADIAARGSDLSKAEETYSLLVRNPQSPVSLRWEAQAGLAEVHAAQGKSRAAEREFNEAISTIAKAQRELQEEEFRFSFLSSAIRFYNAYVNFFVTQHRPADALAIAERSRAQTLAAGLTEPSQTLVTSFPRANPQQLAARFHATLLFYSLGTRHSYLWVITPQKTTLVPLPPQSEVDPLVKSYRDRILDGENPLEAADSPAAKLYSILIAPAANLIPRNSRVIVLPDGSLYSLNFETLIAPNPAPHYWIQDVTLTSASSLTLLQRSPSSLPPQNARLFLVGDAVSSDEQFPPLRQAAREMTLVQAHFPAERLRILSGKDATPPSYFSAQPERFDFLHFVTHGTASRTHPLDSAVILTKSGDSAKLYAHEIITRPLHAYLVTVSACDGVGTRSYAGEGLVGLSWAFLRAGAHNVIASLWEVSDDSTPKLMDELYKGLNSGQDPATALRNAKLSLVRSPGVFRKPFYWAPFQLYAGS
jgi:CHAT domain-containing protein